MPTEITSKTLIQQLGDITGKDAVLEMIANAVNAMIENLLGTTIAQTTYTDQEYDILKSDQRLVLKHRPVVSVTQLQYKDSPLNFDDGSWTTIDTDEYTVDLNSGIITWNSRFLKGKKRYRVTYSAGYATVPADLKYAATKIGLAMFENRKTANIRSETLGQYSRTFGTNPESWKELGIEDIMNKYVNQNLSWFDDAYRPGNEITDYWP